MLWYKGWLETRFKLLFTLGMVCLDVWMLHSLAPNTKTAVVVFMVTFMSQMTVMMAGGMLAGAGINTQPNFQASKGLHGSTQFTLSLPVSRLRLLSVRACIGWLETAGVSALFCSATWLASPLVRIKMGQFDLIRYGLVLIMCGSAIYFLSVLLATFLDEIWRMWITMIATGVFGWLSYKFNLPASIDFIRATGRNSPFYSHTLPGGAMIFSLVLSAAFFYAALKIAQAREY